MNGVEHLGAQLAPLGLGGTGQRADHDVDAVDAVDRVPRGTRPSADGGRGCGARRVPTFFETMKPKRASVPDSRERR